LTIGAAGVIEANGSDGGNGLTGTLTAVGAGSGGGVVAVFYAGTLSNSGTLQANKGLKGTASNTGNTGGDGGDGSVIGPLEIDPGQ
jgi:hypothetical protein